VLLVSPVLAVPMPMVVPPVLAVLVVLISGSCVSETLF
jgi:hypothetical protein